MPVAKGAPPSDPTPSSSEAPADAAGASSVPEPKPQVEVVGAGGVFEYTAPFSTIYGLPLTAHPLIPAVAASEDSPGSPEVPATVFAWPDGPPDDRWTKTRKNPNQAADNDAPLTSTEV